MNWRKYSDRLHIDTEAVLGGCWYQMEFLYLSTPGLVGGHCIGVDPYYSSAKSTLKLGIPSRYHFSGASLE